MEKTDALTTQRLETGIDDTTHGFGSIEQVHEGTDKSLCGVFHPVGIFVVFSAGSPNHQYLW